ncbi:MAG TPA: L-histidine N(alpha)-methyltransferase [Xanthomonadales bacterium]|nr:L-histidine N(alpha)-methyltransferase [Xanthomonadales bacterium]
MPTVRWLCPLNNEWRHSIAKPVLMSCPESSVPSDKQAVDTEFAQSVLDGLSSEPRTLSSRYFYDERGDKLFQSIMSSPEYYLTDCEFEILSEQGDEIARELLSVGPGEFIELGSGDGQKVGFLLDALHRQATDWTFRPVDISDHSLELLADNLMPSRPWLQLDPIHGNYFDVLESLKPGETRRVLMFLGSNLGNFGDQGSVEFLRRVRSAMAPGDALLIGLDLKKDPDVIRAAYNDAAGYTRDFNLNLLARINRELGGDFNPRQFLHQPEYDPESGAARSFLVSRQEQTVKIDALEQSFEFTNGERIFMEVSQKFDEAIIGNLCLQAGFSPARAFYDRRHWFTDQVWHAIE